MTQCEQGPSMQAAENMQEKIFKNELENTLDTYSAQDRHFFSLYLSKTQKEEFL